jgi:ABC-type transport system involved in cytochrome bd biosynthesis fused ATPase/permease subunit
LIQITKDEYDSLRSQFVILETGRGKHTKYLPFAFTEQGVSMLSSVLNSSKAIQVNILIIRAFVFMRQFALTHKDLTAKLQELENKYDKQFKDVYEAINFLLQKDKQETEQRQRKRIGYHK